MPELPDVTVYVERIAERTVGRALRRVRVVSPFVLRTAVPPISVVYGRRVLGVRRMGKRIVLALEDDLFVVIHLMVAGRFKWLAPDAKVPGRIGLAAFDFEHGALVLTEASPKKRASIHVVQGEASLAQFDRGGVDVLGAAGDAFVRAMTRERHTLKRALTDPRVLDGIGNAYSDEILHRARLSPLKLSSAMTEGEWATLHTACRDVLREWTDRLRAESATSFPENVTAFREGMAVHGRYGKPCPVCGALVQRIIYADNETTYCVTCQTGGKLLADRSLSRLLRDDWPRTLEELETQRPAVQRSPNPARSTRAPKKPKEPKKVEPDGV
jgi:formamidopyrimidine-DNA glycosylase